MKKYQLFILMLFSQLSLYCQEDSIYSEENHRVIVLTVDDPCFIMCPYDTIGNYVIYNKKGRVQMWGKLDDTFYIDIPLDLKYEGGDYGYLLLSESYFGNDKYNIVVSFYYEQNQEHPVFGYSHYCELENESIRNKIWQPSRKDIDDNKYFGYYCFGKYFVYYYNVEEKDIELFNKSIKSIRSEK
jgi:hypothetical protein